MDHIRSFFARIGGEIKQHPILIVGVVLTGILVYLAYKSYQNSQSGASSTGAALPIDPLWSTATGGSIAASGNPLTPNPPSSAQPTAPDLSSFVPQPPQFTIDAPTPPSGPPSAPSAPAVPSFPGLAGVLAAVNLAPSDARMGGYNGPGPAAPVAVSLAPSDARMGGYNGPAPIAVSLAPSDARQGGYSGSYAPTPAVHPAALVTASPSVLSRITSAIQGTRAPAPAPAAPAPGVPAHLGMHYQ